MTSRSSAASSLRSSTFETRTTCSMPRSRSRSSAFLGVAEVELFGAQRREVDIYLRLDDIKRHRVDVGSLISALG